MGRLVRGAGGAGLESAQSAGADNYLERVVKYIPSEVVAAYVALDGIFFEDAVRAAPAAPAAAATTAVGSEPQAVMGILDAFSSAEIGAAIFLVCLLFTPVYIWTQSRQNGVKVPWRMQALISTLAFVIWAYATKGMVFFDSRQLFSVDIYDSRLAAAILILFTLVSGLFKPGTAESS